MVFLRAKGHLTTAGETIGRNVLILTSHQTGTKVRQLTSVHRINILHLTAPVMGFANGCWNRVWTNKFLVSVFMIFMFTFTEQRVIGIVALVVNVGWLIVGSLLIISVKTVRKIWKKQRNGVKLHHKLTYAEHTCNVKYKVPIFYHLAC